ncbi:MULTISPECIES: GntR family transcriptional regulator [unclassified Adlercreutzia]|uniref:GntR family transcriptional regulator n=1 Tax=unclassified Adlercreutzia TaxID=2636013 RepID=UPI0013EADD33|nr:MULTISPECIES: GntR family transcriptional regulator [unclassified Adlercreutzia]
MGRLSSKEGASRLTPLQQRILGFIVERTAMGGGHAHCTKREIAEFMKCSAKTVDRAIVRLRAEGVIESHPRFNESGGQEGNTYRVVSSE